MRAASSPSASQRTTILVLSILSIVVVFVLIGAFLLPSGGGGSAGPSTTVDPNAPGTSVPESELTTAQVDSIGFTMKYPKSWTRVDSPTPEIPFLLYVSNHDAIWVRLDRTETPTTPDNIGNIKAITDGIVGRDPTAKILQQRRIAVDSMPGYYYLYTFIDPETGAEAVHGHYFLFRGRKMYSVVVQASPSQGFARLAGVFDQAIESIKTTPDFEGLGNIGPTTTAGA